MTDPASNISGANLQDTAARILNLDDEDLRLAGAPEPNPNVGSVPNNNNDQVAALAAAVTQIQQALSHGDYALLFITLLCHVGSLS